MIFVVAAVVGFAFGAGDQWFGSLTPMVALGPWTVSISQMSAFWLLLPFAFGFTQEQRKRAALLGLVVTASALAGYFAMTVGPVEGVPLSHAPAAAIPLIATNLVWIAGGAVTGPSFAMLGQRWRSRHWWSTAALVGGLLLFEPIARAIRGQVVGPAWVWIGEAAAGATLLAAFTVAAALARRTPRAG